MKIKILLFSYIVFTLIFFGCDKGERISNPQFESNRNEFIYVGLEEIELTDTATIIDISLYNVPGYWVSVSPHNKLIGKTTGKHYSLKWIEGLAPDIMVHVDSTGFLSAKLFFEPVDENDREIDFYEEDNPVIKGIKLYDDTQDKIKTNLSGTLDGMGNSWVLLWEENTSSENKTLLVPVRNGKFNYDIYTSEPLVYSVYIGKEFREGFIENAPKFWSEGGNIVLNFQDGSSKNYTLEGGKLTKEFKDFQEKRDSVDNILYEKFPELNNYKLLMQNNAFYKPEYYRIIDEIKKSTIGSERLKGYRKYREFFQSEDIFTEEGKKSIQEYDECISQNWDYIKSFTRSFRENMFHKTSLTHLFILYDEIKKDDENLERDLEIFDEFYRDAYKNHSYHKYLEEISGLMSPIEGNHFINLSFPVQNGKNISLSELIEGKISLIIFNPADSLPSIATQIGSLYKSFQAKGFEIVWVLPDSLNEHKIKEINKFRPGHILYDTEKINAYKKYRVGDEKIKILLIDENGIIQKTDPSIEQINTFLN